MKQYLNDLKTQDTRLTAPYQSPVCTAAHIGEVNCQFLTQIVDLSSATKQNRRAAQSYQGLLSLIESSLPMVNFAAGEAEGAQHSAMPLCKRLTSTPAEKLVPAPVFDGSGVKPEKAPLGVRRRLFGATKLRFLRLDRGFCRVNSGDPISVNRP